MLERMIDSTGVSGTGIVAEGVEFRDGTVALRWVVGPSPSTSLWASIADLEAVHGHNGDTVVQWSM